jgi:hypothetical protein
VIAALPWVSEGSKHRRCTEHDVVFPKTQVCPKCPKEGLAPIKLARAQLPKPPKGCKSMTEIEAWFVSLAEEARTSASDVERRASDKLTEGVVVATGEVVEVLTRDFHDEAAIAKHRENAIKAMRAAADFASRREDDELVDIRDERNRGASH